MKREGKQRESVIWVIQRKSDMKVAYYHYYIEITSINTVKAYHKEIMWKSYHIP